MASSGRKKRGNSGRSGLTGYFAATRSALVGFAVTLPLLLLYNVGLLMPGADQMNAADLMTGIVMRYAGLKGFLIVNGLLVLTSVVLMLVLFRRGLFRPGQWVALCIEGLVYGLAMGFGVVAVLKEVHVLAIASKHQWPAAQALAMAAGAGYWEELVFRLGLVGGAMHLARRVFRDHTWSNRFKRILVGAAAIALSSLLFSAAHYLGSESFEPYTFWYRSLSGVVFAAIFLVRGFAVCAYTHFLYDVVVMVF